MSCFKFGGKLSKLFYQHFLCLLYLFGGKTKLKSPHWFVPSPSFLHLHKHANQFKILCLYLSFGQNDKEDKERLPPARLNHLLVSEFQATASYNGGSYLPESFALCRSKTKKLQWHPLGLLYKQFTFATKKTPILQKALNLKPVLQKVAQSFQRLI